ncbi:MAG: WD40 repeat domain-containing protein [Fimbriimonadaceae bacterium]|nr:WD40 repeat domain-containing protein [Fimbriimonadaceae bacterium]
MAFSPDSSMFATGGFERGVKVWSTETGECLSKLEGHNASVNSLCFSPDGYSLASASVDKTIKLWSVEYQKLISTFSEHTQSVSTVDFSHDGTVLASGSADGSIILWDLPTGMVQRHLLGHSDGITSVKFSPNQQQLASGSHDKTIRLWNVFDHPERSLPVHGEDINARQRVISGHDDSIYSIAFSPTGRFLLSGSGDGTIMIWEDQNPKHMHGLIL